jgi:peptidoglycan/LPS O-acetylase OafA/YrhL
VGFLRLLLAVWVAGGHAALYSIGQTLPDPAGAVIVFFAISGFLMTKVLTRRQSQRWISTFYLSRALRIFPLYLITLLVTVICSAAGIIDTSIGFGPVGNPFGNIIEYWNISGAGARVLIIGANLTTVFQDVLRQIVYVPSAGAFSFYAPHPTGAIPGLSFNIVGQAWSLGPEILFYLAAPFFVRNANYTIGILLICAAAHFSGADMYVHYGPAFLTGVLLAHIGTPPRLLILAAIALSLEMVIDITAPGGKALVTLLILTIPFAAMVRSRTDEFIGEMSYPLYITHFLVFQACASASGREVVTTAAMLAMSLIATLAIERPLRRYRHNLSSDTSSTRARRQIAMARGVE